ncbi:MAG: helix-turn-helix transcriptional regulator [Eubacteriales bacterium]
MSSEFSRTLALLRQEKKVSQREAAEALGISQALMSHYEKGVREPGLLFVVKACDYYGVSSDYLLGRTLERSGKTLGAEELNSAEGPDTKLSVLATLNKKLALNSMGMLFDLYAATNNRDLIIHLSNYLAGTISVLFRRLHNVSPETNSSFFAVSQPQFMAGAYDMEHKANEIHLLETLATHKKSGGEWHDLNHDALTAQYGPIYQSLLQNLYGTGERTNKLLGSAPKKSKK